MKCPSPAPKLVIVPLLILQDANDAQNQHGPDRHQVFLRDLPSRETSQIADNETSSGSPRFGEAGIMWSEVDPEGFPRLYCLEFSSGETTLIIDSNESGIWPEWPYIEGSDVLWTAEPQVGKDVFPPGILSRHLQTPAPIPGIWFRECGHRAALFLLTSGGDYCYF